MSQRTVPDPTPDSANRCTTGSVWVDEDGNLRNESGAFSGIQSLETFVDQISGIVGVVPGGDEAAPANILQKWGDCSAPPVQAILKTGERRLLTSHPHAEGGTVYLSVDISNSFNPADRAREVLSDAIESLSEGFALYDENDRLVLCNERYREMNKAAEDIIEPGMSWEMLMRTLARRGVYKDAIGREEEWVSERLANGVEFIQDFELRHTDGRTYLVSVHPTRLGGFVVTRTDITAMKQAEAIERDSDLLVRKVLDSGSAVVVMARIGDGQILYRSPAAVELFGDFKNAAEHYSNPNDRADYVTEMLVDGRVDDFRIRAVNAKGQEFNALVSGRIAEYKGEEVIVSHIQDQTEQLQTEARIRKVLEACPVPVQMTRAESGEPLFRSRETIALFGDVDTAKSYYAHPQDRVLYLERLKRDGYVQDLKVELINASGKKFWGAFSARLIDFNGEKAIVSNTRDLTDELAVQEELASQRELLFQNEKMSALGELLAGVAHELNNPLSVVVGHSLMLREEASDPQTLERIEKISRSAERCAKIVKTFLAMARQRPARLEPLEIDALINTASDVASYGLAGNAVEITKDIATDIPEVQADPEQITQVIINLIINAEHAMKQSGKGGRIELAARYNRLRQALEISVADDGPGVTEALRPRIFEPFFTTKEVGEGTGIGLAFCHRILHSHNGRIWLDPDHGDGSRFVLSLPIAAAGQADNEDLENARGSLTGIRVLVVDDEVDVADLIAEILRLEGCRVTYARSGIHALKALANEKFDIVLSDLNMPDLDGRGLFKAICTDYPEIANFVAFITGDSMGVASQNLLGEAERPYLEKPISPSELRELVHKLLREKKG